MALPQNQIPTVFETFVNAQSVDEACKALGPGDGTIVAGGTDLWVQKDEAQKTFGPRLISISNIQELAKIEIDKDRVRLGARVTMTDILANEDLGEIAPALREAANKFASPQIRNAATIERLARGGRGHPADRPRCRGRPGEVGRCENRNPDCPRDRLFHRPGDIRAGRG